MGKGDRKTRRGKTYRSSYGNTRLHCAKHAVAAGASSAPTKPAVVKKTAAPKKKTA